MEQMTHYIHQTSKTNAEGKGDLFGRQQDKHPAAVQGRRRGTAAHDSQWLDYASGCAGLVHAYLSDVCFQHSHWAFSSLWLYDPLIIP